MSKKGNAMPRYLFQGCYTAEGLKSLHKDTAVARRATLIKAVESLGGKLEAAYWCFGQTDTLGVAEMPDNVNAATFALAVSVGGHIRVTTTPLLTAEELDRALQKCVTLHPHSIK
jgi:uncharacterized protein with GYD domain